MYTRHAFADGGKDVRQPVVNEYALTGGCLGSLNCRIKYHITRFLLLYTTGENDPLFVKIQIQGLTLSVVPELVIIGTDDCLESLLPQILNDVNHARDRHDEMPRFLDQVLWEYIESEVFNQSLIQFRFILVI